MTNQAQAILKQLPALLRDDELFRFELWKILSQEYAGRADLRLVLDEIERSRREADKRFEAMDRRFEAVIQEIHDLREETNRRFEAMEKRQDDLHSWVGTVVGGFQVRAGRRLEDAIAGTLRIALRITDVDPDKIVLRRKITDSEGRIGPAGRTYEIDIMVTDGQSWIFEVKTVADEEEIERFNDKAELAIATIPLPGAHKGLITLDKSAGVRAICGRLGITLG